MKIKKTTAVATAACMAIVCGGILTACADPTVPPETDGPNAQVTIDWQFEGAYNRTVDHGLYELSGEYEVLMNLTSDGSGSVNFYFIGNAGRSDSTWSETLTWKTETDRDGLTLLTINDGINPSGAYEIYQESDGTFELGNYYMPLGKGSTYHREPNLTGSKNIRYATVAEWETAVKTKYENMTDDDNGDDDEKKPILTFEATSGEANVIEFYADNTATIKAFDGKVSFAYTWAIADGTITLTSVDKPDEKIVSAESDGTVIIVYSASLGGNAIELTFTCDDIGALENVGEKTAIVTFDGGEGNSIVFYADKTAVLSAYGGRMNFDYTWSVSDGVITLTSVASPDEKIVSQTTDGIVTLTYTAAFLQGNVITFTCDDISALTA